MKKPGKIGQIVEKVDEDSLEREDSSTIYEAPAAVATNCAIPDH